MTARPADFRVDEVANAFAGLIDGATTQRLVHEVLRPIPNLWDVIDYGDEAGEIRYSKMIGWLLNPQENHGLGASFAQAFVNAAFGDAAPTISPRARVHPREWRSIDVLLVDYDEDGVPVVTLAIENKTDTVEHPRSGLDIAQTTWYRWVIGGEFTRIVAAIETADMAADKRSARLARVEKWRQEPGDYDDIPETGRWFVYLTPREEQAEDGAFQTVTYSQLEALLDRAVAVLEPRNAFDAVKLVRDFRSAIHRRYDVSLGEAIRDLYGEPGEEVDGELLAPELTGLAQQLGFVDEEHAKPGDSDYVSVARAHEGCVEEAIAALNGRLSPPLSDIEFARLVEHVWAGRPQRKVQDQSKDPAVVELVAAVARELEEMRAQGALSAVIEVKQLKQTIELQTAETVSLLRYEHSPAGDRKYRFGLYYFAPKNAVSPLTYVAVDRSKENLAADWELRNLARWTAAYPDLDQRARALAESIRGAVEAHAPASPVVPVETGVIAQ